MSEIPNEDLDALADDEDDEDGDEETEVMEQTTHLAVFLEEGFYDHD